MRRKISDIAKVAGDLPELTAHQYEFVRGLVEGKNASDAYRAAYDTSNCKPSTVWHMASMLRSDSKVSQWIAAAHIAGFGAQVLTKEAHVAELDRLKELALASGNVGAAVQAEQLRGKASGHYIEKHEITFDDPAEDLSRMREISPEFATWFVEHHKIGWGNNGQTNEDEP